MRLVNRQQRDFSDALEPIERLGFHQAFGRDIDETQIPAGDPIERRSILSGIVGGVEACRRDTIAAKLRDLIAHERDQRRAARERSWEFIGHGFSQRSMQKVADERGDIRKTREVISKATGKPPRGWLGPGLTETWETPDLLVEAGYDYLADWVLDDQPVWLKTRGRPILNLPYTQEINDVAMMAIQQHKADEYCDRALDQFEQIYADSADSARVMALVAHPYLMGVPHRLKYLRRVFEVIRQKRDVLFWTGAQIVDWYLAAGPKAP